MRKTFRAKRIDNGEWVEGYYVKTVDLLYKKELYLILEQNQLLCLEP